MKSDTQKCTEFKEPDAMERQLEAEVCQVTIGMYSRATIPPSTQTRLGK